MSNGTARQDQQTEQAAPRPYHAPRLHVYGAMRDLTAAGTFGVVEKGMNADRA